MEDFPAEYTAHNLPLVLLSGLGTPEDAGSRSHRPQQQESGTRLAFASSECGGQKARLLLQQFLKHDGRDRPWNASSLPGPQGNMKYCVKPIGRTYTLAPRKAAPPPQEPSAESLPNRQRSPSKSTELHSTLSPLSPGSPLFPDGVFTPLWLSKHQDRVPSVLVACFDMLPGNDTTQDDQLKADINAVRGVLSRSGFRTRFAAVLLSEQSILHAPELEERLSSIRRSTSLDTKTGLFFMPPMSSQAEVNIFVTGIMTTLQPLCVEYYRDLTKHARRKKTRGFVPAPSAMPSGGAAKTLSSLGWNLRYEIKQGVFAEFRQEMDIAERHYSQAVEDLFNSEGVFESTPSWSPRWDEARLLCDVLAMRVIRAQLWNGATTGAAMSWSNYRTRLQDLVDRRGKGSQTYSWEAWESRWARIMAELTQRANLPVFHIQPKQSMEESMEIVPLRTYAPPEKSFANAERVAPFRLLHHAGYWLRLAVKGSRARWQRALAIPEEDRTPPGQSPASVVAGRTQLYDHFMVPEPHEEVPLANEKGFDHLDQITKLSYQTIQEFDGAGGRGQTRLADQVKLDLGRDLVAAGQHHEASQILAPLYAGSGWREDGWQDLFSDLLCLLHQCAQDSDNWEMILSTTWELLTGNFNNGKIGGLDVSRCLSDLAASSNHASTIHFKDRERRSPVTVRFAFATKQGFVGDPIGCQMTLISNADEQSEPIVLSRIMLLIGPLEPLIISHDPDSSRTSLTEVFKTTTSQDVFPANVNLTLAPGQTRAFNFALTFREAETVELAKATICVSAASWELQHEFEDNQMLQSEVWYHSEGTALKTVSLHRHDTATAVILPKPPKLQVLVHGLKKQYYVGERVRLQVDFVNEEEDAVTGSVSQSVTGLDDKELGSTWTETGAFTDSNKATDSVESVKKRAFDDLVSGATLKIDIVVDAPLEAEQHSLAIDVDYALASEPNTPLQKTMIVELPYAALFESKLSFGPLLHSEPWPSYFDPKLEPSEARPSGIPQRWRLGSQLTSLASEAVMIKSTDIVTDHVAHDAVLTTLTNGGQRDQVVAASGKFETNLEMLTRKISLDDRRPIVLELSLAIKWLREAGSEVFTTLLPLPRLNIPASEPRVLCTVAAAEDEGADAILQYHLENPSNHFLTFALTLEANEDFAFSGVKYRNLSLAPLSRHHVDFRIIAHANGEETKVGGEKGRWIYPVLQVVDSFYQKTLRVQAANPGIRLDAQRGLAVWIPSHRS